MSPNFSSGTGINGTSSQNTTNDDLQALNNQLIEAVEQRNVERCRNLLRNGGNANAKDRYDIPLLCKAVIAEDIDILTLLIANGADVNVVIPTSNEDHMSILHAAAQRGLAEIVDIPLQNHAKVDVKTA